MMQKLLFLLIASTTVYLTSGYGAPPTTECIGKSICVAVVEGLEYGEADELTGEVVCDYGFTEVGSEKWCAPPCNQDKLYNCTCVSKSVATQRLFEESFKDLMVGAVAIVLFFAVIVLQCHLVRKYNRKVDRIAAEMIKNKREDIQMMLPKPYPWWPFLILYIITLAMGIKFLKDAMDTQGKGFWEGCDEL